MKVLDLLKPMPKSSGDCEEVFAGGDDLDMKWEV